MRNESERRRELKERGRGEEKREGEWRREIIEIPGNMNEREREIWRHTHNTCTKK